MFPVSQFTGLAHNHDTMDPSEIYFLKRGLKRVQQHAARDEARAPWLEPKKIQPAGTLHAVADTDGDPAACTAMLERGDNIDEQIGRQQLAPLHLAADNGHFALASMLLAAGARVNVTDAFGQTPLIFASKHSSDAHAQLCALLLCAGANVNIADVCGKTPLFHAARRKDIELVRALGVAGADGAMAVAAALDLPELCEELSEKLSLKGRQRAATLPSSATATTSEKAASLPSSPAPTTRRLPGVAGPQVARARPEKGDARDIDFFG